jgi:hypothetical protein
MLNPFWPRVDPCLSLKTTQKRRIGLSTADSDASNDHWQAKMTGRYD